MSVRLDIKGPTPDSPPPPPPLLILLPSYRSQYEADRIQGRIAAGDSVLVLPDDAKVYQRVLGRWEPLPDAARPKV